MVVNWDLVAVALGTFAVTAGGLGLGVIWWQRGKVINVADGVSLQEETLAKAALPDMVIDPRDGLDAVEKRRLSLLMRSLRKPKVKP